MNLPFEFYIALKYMKANIKQSFIVMLAVGIGVSLIIFIPSVNMSFYKRLLNRAVEKAPNIIVSREIKTGERNQFLITQKFPISHTVTLSDKTLSRKRNILAYRSVIEKFMNIPGVLAAAPYVEENVIVVRGSKTQGATLQGIIPELEQQVTKLEEDIEKGQLSDLKGDNVFLGWRIADELGVNIGSRVQLITSKGIKSFKVIGTINTGLYYKDFTMVVTDLKSAQKLLNLSGEVTAIGLKIKDVYQAEEIAHNITRSFGLKAQSWMNQNKLLLDELKNFEVIVGFIDFLIVFAAASSITSILIMVVSSKAKEIGILKAMGATPGKIVRLFMIQSVILSLAGSIVGIIGGVGIIEFYNLTPYARMESAFGFQMEPAAISARFVVMAIIYSLVSSFIASCIPAWQAGKLNPVEAINK